MRLLVPRVGQPRYNLPDSLQKDDNHLHITSFTENRGQQCLHMSRDVCLAASGYSTRTAVYLSGYY
jgi:hypothetical protein